MAHQKDLQELALSALPAGIYLLRLQMEEAILVKQIIKQ